MHRPANGKVLGVMSVLIVTTVQCLCADETLPDWAKVKLILRTCCHTVRLPDLDESARTVRLLEERLIALRLFKCLSIPICCIGTIMEVEAQT